MGWELVDGQFGLPPMLLDAHDVRNDLARFLDHDPVADANIFALNLLGVMQAGPCDRGACQLHWLQFGDRRYRACFSNLHADFVQSSNGFVLFDLYATTQRGLLLVRPSFSRQVELVQLEHQAIDFEIELVQFLLPALRSRLRHDRWNRTSEPWGRGQAKAVQLLQEINVVFAVHTFAIPDTVAKETQVALGAKSWVLHAHGPGCDVARIGKRSLSLGHPLAS